MLARLKSLTGQSLTYGLASLLPKAIGFFLIPLYTHFLTPDDYGILAFVATVGSVLGILLTVGQDGALVRFHYDYLDDPKEQRNFYGTIWIFLTLFSLGLTLLFDWQGNRLFGFIFEKTPFDPYGRLALWLAFVTLASAIPLALFRVREQAARYVAVTVSRFVLNTLLIIYFVAVLRQGALGSLRGQLITGLIFLIPFTWISIRSARLKFQWKKIKAALAFGIPLVPHQISGWALSVSDRILLERFVTLDQLGLYSLGYSLAMILDLILYSVNLAWAPFFYRTAATEEDAAGIFASLTTYYFLVVLFLGLGIALLSKDLIKVMSTPAYYGAIPVVPVVVLAYISHGFYFMIVNQLFYAKATKRLPLYTLISATVNIVLNLVMLSRFGIMAAAWNTVIGYVILSVLVYRDSSRVYPVPYEFKRLGVLLGAALVTYLLGSLVNLPNPFIEFGARLLAISAFPLILFAVQFFTPRELAGMRTLPRRLRNRFSN